MWKFLSIFMMTLAFVGAVYGGIFLWRSVSDVSGTMKTDVGIVRQLLGFKGERTYLVLLQNNHELRPTGGFIGVYGILQIAGGHVTFFQFEGTELLDKRATKGLPLPYAPEAIRTYLRQNYLFFRDANWNPDFRKAAHDLVKIFSLEKGNNAAKIDGVIAITPDVVAKLLESTGPITVSAIKFDAATFADQLEYEVEIAYKERGIAKETRKKIIHELADALHTRVRALSLKEYMMLFDKIRMSLNEKQLLLFDFDPTIQAWYETQGFSGAMHYPAHDFVSVIDANLGGFKTDRVMKRAFSYSVQKSRDAALGTLSLRYENQGVKDYRTRDYRSYTRVFLPKNSRILKLTGSVYTASGESGFDVSTSEESTIVGFFHKVPLQKTTTIILEYALPKVLYENFEQDTYTLFFRKQPGVKPPALTVNMKFDSSVLMASPEGKVDGTHYVFKGDLKTDRTFSIITDK